MFDFLHTGICVILHGMVECIYEYFIKNRHIADIYFSIYVCQYNSNLPFIIDSDRLFFNAFSLLY